MKNRTIFTVERAGVDRAITEMTNDYPILKSLGCGERLEAYEIVCMHLRSTWRAEVYDVLEMFAVELEDREHRPSRGGR